MKRLSLLIPIFSLMACTLPKEELFEPDYEPEVSVFGVLSNDADYEFVIVERTLLLNEDFENNDTQQSLIIDDARVFVIGATDTVEFFFKQDKSVRGNDSEFTLARGAYFDSSHGLEVIPGERYSLSVELADGQCVTGETWIPSAPKIQKPKQASVLHIQEVKQDSIIWKGHPDDFLYLPRFLIPTWTTDYADNPSEIVLLYNVSEEGTWTSLGPVYYFYQNNNPNKFQFSATIKVYSLDQNLYDYTQKSGLAELTGQSLNLVKGGVGVFGSMMADSVTVSLVN